MVIEGAEGLSRTRGARGMVLPCGLGRLIDRPGTTLVGSQLFTSTGIPPEAPPDPACLTEEGRLQSQIS